AWSAPQYFNIAPLAAPTTGDPTGAINTPAPTFSWSPVTGAAHYDLWVNDLSTGQGQVLRVPNISSTVFTPTASQALMPGASYVWWAGAVTTNGQATFWSSPQYFYIVAPTATASSPSGGISTDTPTFSWSAAPDATHYDLWVNDVSSGQSQVVRAPKVAGTS